MKKLFASVFVSAAVLCLTSCSVAGGGGRTMENGLDCSFTSEADITLDKLRAEGTISRFGEGEWEAEFTSPNTLSGVKLTFSGGNVSADYKGLSFSVPRSALPVKAMLLELIEAVDTNARADKLSGSEKEGIFMIEDSLEGGDYILCLDENGDISSFDMPNNLLRISFHDVQHTEAQIPDVQPETVQENTIDNSCTQ